MALYQDWLKFAQMERPQAEQQAFWKDYFEIEKQAYKKILSAEAPFTGSLSDLAKTFNMESVVFAGFVDGINSSLAAGEYDLEELSEDKEISLAVDLDKLYYNMLDAKADWLYNLPEWDVLLDPDARAAINKQFKEDKIYIAEPKVGRNDPCPCGSGKKYKQCCAKKA